MAKRALVAEPDGEEALRQAAILKDDGFEAVVFSGNDLVAEVETSPPDLILLRHERPGSQTGLALVPRIKAVAGTTAIVITTTDLTPDAIEKNRKQKVHADGYLRLPADRAELCAAARAVPESSKPPEPAAPEGEKPPPDPKRPPPLPPTGNMARAMSRPLATPGKPGDAVLTADDLTFVEKVFSTIQHVDPDASQADIPISQVGHAEDRKVSLLRTELKRRERELAKLSRLWKAREEDLRQKESRVQAKDIEIEGLRLRIQELTSELERAHQGLLQKEAEFGRAMGERYDEHSLQEAELIQQVSAKEYELNSLKTKLRRTEDAFAQERKEFTERVFEWEKAYSELDQHHWKVVEASVDEVRRLEGQIVERERERREVKTLLKDRELAIEALRERLHGERRRTFDVEFAHGLFEDAVVARAHGVLMHERRARLEADDEVHELRARALALEEDLARHQRLLWQLDQHRRRELAHLASVARLGDAERTRLLGERAVFAARADVLEAALDETRALGEALAHQLFTLEEKRKIVGELQVRVRDEKLGELTEDLTRVSTNLADVTERLGQSEMEHAAEQARADDLERALGETREAAAETEGRLARDLEVLTIERDKLADHLQRTEASYATTREELAEARHSRQQRELEVQGLFERKETELAAKAERVVELERNLGDTKEDLQNLRKTVTLRDDRITELLNRARQSDEQQVALEGQVFRLTTQVQEHEAELTARQERLEKLAQRLAQREEKLEAVEEELRRTNGVVLDKQAAIERQDQAAAALQAELGRQREHAQHLQAELAARANELFETERKAATLAAELQNARADIAAGGAVAEQLQAQLQAVELRAADQKRALDDTDARLRNALVDLDAAGQRGEQQRAELAEVRERAAQHERELQATRTTLADTERVRDALQAQASELSRRVAEGERDHDALEEQLAAQVRENAEFSASLSDASQRLEEQQGAIGRLHDEVQQREGRISALSQVLERAEAQAKEQEQALADAREEASDLRQSLDDAKSAIDERGRWLQTRETSIAELKAVLETERAARDAATTQLAALQQKHTALERASEQTRARLDERERLLQAQGAHSAQELGRESERADAAESMVREARAQLEQLGAEANALRGEAARAAELKAAEEKTRADALRLRQIAEKAANDLRTLKALAEKSEAARKQAEADVVRARAEIDDIRNGQRQGEALVAQARLEGEQRIARMRDLEQQVARLSASQKQAESSRAEAEQEIARAKLVAEQELAGERNQLREQVQRLQQELAAAKKGLNDAVAVARQAKAESEQIKRLAAEKIKQVQAAARETGPPRAAPTVGAASMPPRTASSTSHPAVPPPPPPPGPPVQGQRPSAVPAPPPITGLSPPQGASVTNPGFAMPGPGGAPKGAVVQGVSEEAFNERETVVVEIPVIPSAARGDKG